MREPDPQISPELERLERWLRTCESPTPRPELIAAVRLRIGIEIGRAWLASTNDPTLREETVRAVRGTVRKELRVVRAAGSSRRLVLSRGFGALSAAALVGLAVGVAWWAGSLSERAGGADAADSFLALLAPESETGERELALLTDELSALEEDLWAVSSWTGSFAFDPLDLLDTDLGRFEREAAGVPDAS